MVGARAPGTEQISQRRIFDVSNAYKKKKNGRAVQGLWFPGGVGGRGTGPRDGACDVSNFVGSLWGGGRHKGSGRGGPRASILGG